MQGEGALLTGQTFEQLSFPEVDKVVYANVIESLLDTYEKIQAIERTFGDFARKVGVLHDLGLTELGDEHARLTVKAEKLQKFCDENNLAYYDEHGLVAGYYIQNKEAA